MIWKCLSGNLFWAVISVWVIFETTGMDDITQGEQEED